MSDTKKIIDEISRGTRGGRETAQVTVLSNGRPVTRHVRKDRNGDWKDLSGNVYV